jgi:hypothetical protein
LDSDGTTIISRAAAGIYTNLEDVVSDVKAACSNVLDELQPPDDTARTQYTPVSTSITELASKVNAFQMLAEDIMEGEKAHHRRKLSIHPNQSEKATESLRNGTVLPNDVTQLTNGGGNNKMVLTLFGNATGGKQLFSSLQQPVKTLDGSTDVTQPLREAGLPNGISTTQIIPLQPSGVSYDTKRVPTMGELFTNSGSATPFQPPKPSQHASTRSAVVGWYQPASLDNVRSRSSQSYFGQTVTRGEWLDYTGASPSHDAKRKQRDRALSLGGAKVSSSSAHSEELESSKLEALFRSAYSSFAPVRDDSAAIVPEGLVNRMWWQWVGEKSFGRVVRNWTKLESLADKPKSEIEEINEGDSDDHDVLDVEEVKRAIEEWDEQAIDPDLKDDPKSIEDKDVEEILQEVSELLETLNSYQRIRNLTLNPLPRSVGTSSGSDPAKPSESEIATYNTLKSQLSLMIAMLPPYAVAKLNSDQLAELKVSTKIQVLANNYKGAMQEEEDILQAKVAEMRAATTSRPASSTSIHRTPSSLYGNQYSSVRSANPSGQFYAQSQTPVRPASTNLQRPPSTAPGPYPGARPSSSTAFRPQSTYNTPTYPHQLPRTAQSQYGPSNTQQYFQTPRGAAYGQGAMQPYGSVAPSAPQTSFNARYSAVQGAYQQNRSPSAQNGTDYRYNNGIPTARQASPQKPHAYSPQPQTTQPPSRPYGTPSMGQDRYFPSSTVNGSTSQPSQPQAPQAQQPPQAANLGATGYHTVMTAEQQSTMMERQRAQLAQQQGTQVNARNAAQAGMSVSPGPQVNGGSVVAAGN